MGYQDKGIYFEDYHLKDKFVSEGRTVTESDIMSFAELSRDYNQIHTDKAYAKKTKYREQIAHGLLGLSIVSGLASKLGFAEKIVIALRRIDWKFTAPVKIGDTIKAIFCVKRIKNLVGQDGGVVVFKVVVTNQRDEKVQAGNWTMVIKKRAAK